ncbi:hypothetical protein [Streptomyces sp. NBC_00344]|uniref:hypothetical protein n=1 Tax=Streptomyces sp. NBC_00344 TaxID=2975720 RepID=UPI002E1DBFC3
MEQKPADEETSKPRRKQLDLSVPQVAGSAFAAVMAAVLASKLGVYGTIIGAGLVSVIATCGGTVFQHLFRRTGEQIREVRVQVKPKVLKVPVHSAPGARDPGAVPAAVAGPWPEDARNGAAPALPDDGYTAPTVHGTRVRGWKRSSIAAVVAFLVAMTGITGFELLSGHDLDGGIGTTVGSVVHGGGAGRPAPSTTPTGTTHRERDGNRGQDDGGSRSPEPTPSGSAGNSRQPEPDPGKSGSTTGRDPSPAPSSPGAVTPSPTPSQSATGDGSDATGTSTPAG